MCIFQFTVCNVGVSGRCTAIAWWACCAHNWSLRCTRSYALSTLAARICTFHGGRISWPVGIGVALHLFGYGNWVHVVYVVFTIIAALFAVASVDSNGGCVRSMGAIKPIWYSINSGSAFVRARALRPTWQTSAGWPHLIVIAPHFIGLHLCCVEIHKCYATGWAHWNVTSAWFAGWHRQ